MNSKIAITGGIVFVAILVAVIFSSSMFPSLDCPAGTVEKDNVCVNVNIDDSNLVQVPISPLTDDSASQNCLGSAQCISGTVTSVIDGDTLEVNGNAVRFALVDTPKMKYDGGQALSFLEQICPVGSPVLIDQDDQQLEDAYGRVLGMVYCNDLNVNKELLDSGLGDLYSAFCDQSEFATQPWAQKHGCDTFESETSVVNDIGFSMSSDELEQQMRLDPNLVVIDMRDSNSYMNGHITHSSVDMMEGATHEKRIKTMFGKIPNLAESMHVVLVGDSQSNALDSAQIMNDAGITTSFLVGGIESWDDELSTKMNPTTIDSEALYQQLQNQDDIYLLDVREPSELEVTMISGSQNIPLSDIFVEGNLSEIPTDKPVVIVCGSGNRATIATYELAQHDIDFQVLDGGIKAWDKYLEENNFPKY